MRLLEMSGYGGAWIPGPCCQRPPVGGAVGEAVLRQVPVLPLSSHTVVVHLVLATEHSQGHSGHPLELRTICYLKIWAKQGKQAFPLAPPCPSLGSSL